MDIELTAALKLLVIDEWANYQTACREAVRKGLDVPADPTLGSLAESLEQLPDDIVESITSCDPDPVREQMVDLVDRYGRDEPLPELDA